MLIILDKNPKDAATLVPNKIKFKQLLELGQLICSVKYSSVFKPVAQGKEIQEWIKRNPRWVFSYFKALLSWSINHVKMSYETKNKFMNILYDFYEVFKNRSTIEIKTAIFRYSLEYKNTQYSSNSELPISRAIKEYRKYVEWKGSIWR